MQQQMNEIENGTLDFKFHQLPLARVKKVMKADEDAKVKLSLRWLPVAASIDSTNMLDR